MASFSVFFDHLSSIPQQELDNYFITYYPNKGPALEKKPCMAFGRMIRGPITRLVTGVRSSLLKANYQIEETANKILTYLENNRELITNPAHVLQGTSRLTQITRRVLEKQNQDPSLIQVLLLTATCDYLNSEAEMQGKAPLELAVQLDILPEAHVLIEQGSDLASLSQQSKNKLLGYFLDVENMPLAAMLVTHGAELKGQIEKCNPLLLYYIREKNIASCFALIDAGVNGDNAIVEACRSSLIEVVQKLAERGTSLRTRAENSDTLLHIAAINGSLELLDWLSSRLDVTAVDNNNETAFTHLKSTNKFRLKGELEQAFLLQDLPKCRLILSKLTEQKARQEVEKLQKAYPQTPVGHILYEVDTKHYVHKQFLAMPKTKAPGCSVNDLSTLFGRVNFSSPTKEFYVDPQSYKDDVLITSKPALWFKMKGLIKSINKRSSYTGVPSGSAKTLFYDDLERMITHTVSKIKSMPESQEKSEAIRETVVEFLKASSHCGGRLFQTASERYRAVMRGRKETFEEETHNILANYREELLISLAPDSSHNVNSFNHLMTKLGKELGIPGADTANNFNDPYGSIYDIHSVRQNFKNLYSSKNIIYECIRPAIEQSGAYREKCITWFKENVPATYLQDEFSEIVKQARCTPPSEINTYLNSKDIYPSKGQSFEDAIEEERRSRYVAEMVVEDITAKKMQIKPDAVAYMLVQLGILKKLK